MIPWTAAHQASLSFTISWSLLKFMSTELVMPSSHLILCYPLLLLPSIFSSIRVFSNELALHIRWPKIRASASILPLATGGIKPRPGGHWFSLPFLTHPQASLFPVSTCFNTRPPLFRIHSLHPPQGGCHLFALSLEVLPLPTHWHGHRHSCLPTPNKPFSPSALPLKALTFVARPLTRVSTALIHL